MESFYFIKRIIKMSIVLFKHWPYFYPQPEAASAAEEEEDKESDSGISDASGQQTVAPSYVQLLTQVPCLTGSLYHSCIFTVSL